jgi:hypothetical protein
MLIIWRVASGRAWSRKIVREASAAHLSSIGPRTYELDQARSWSNKVGSSAGLSTGHVHVSITREKHELA